MAEIWAFISGNALPLIMMVLGFALLILEIYMPGFGIPGISGSIMLIVGVVLIADTLFQGLLIGLILVALLGVAFTLTMRSAAKGKVINKKLVLDAVATVKDEENPIQYYLGKQGTAATKLAPVGSCEIDGARLSVMTDGEFVSAGEKVIVSRIEGKQIYVRRA